MPDYTLTQTAATVDSTLVKSATYIPKASVTVTNIAARNAIATADKENGKVVRVLDDGSGNVAYYSWNSGGSTWDNAYFPVEDGTITSASLDTNLYNDIYEPSYTAETEVTQEITSLPSTVVAGAKLDMVLKGNTQTPYDQYTKLLMRFEGTDGSTTFTDQTGKTVTPSGNAQIDTAQYKFGSASGLFDGTGDYLTVDASDGSLNLGTGDFCIRQWVRFSSGVDQIIVDFRQTTNTDVAPNIYFYGDTTDKIAFRYGTTVAITGTTSIVTGQWYHIAVARSGGVTKLFINGGQEGSSYIDNNNYINVTSIRIGASYAGAAGFAGWMDDLDISVGTPRYTSNFTPLPLSVLSSDKMRVLSEPKNLFDINSYFSKTTNSIITIGDSVEFTAPSTNTSQTFYTRVEEYTNDIVGSAVSSPLWYTTTGEKTVTITTTGASVYKLTIGVNGNVADAKLFYRLKLDPNSVYKLTLNITTLATTNGKCVIDNTVMIEKSSTVTYATRTYVPYDSQQAICPTVLRSVPAISDTWNANTGEIVKNVEVDTDVSGTQYDSYSTALTNVDVVVTTAFALSKFGGSGIDGTTKVIDKNGKLLTEVADTAADDVANVGKYAWTSSGKVWFIVAKGAYVDIAAARIGLGTSQVYYQLATPVPTYYASAVLNAEASGRFIVEPFVWDYDFYDSGCVVTDANYPISSLSYVNIIDKETGAETPVALSTCTVATGGLSFTSTAISAEDFVEFGYNHQYLSTVPTSTYSYDDSTIATIVSLRSDVVNLDKKVNDLQAFDKSRVMTTTLNVGAVSATATYGTFIAPYDCEIADVKIISDTAISANDTNYWTIEFIDKGSDGSASNVICTSNTTVATGSEIVAFDARDIGAVDATHGKLSKGDVAVIKFTKTASATTMAQCTVVVNYIIGN